MSGRESMMIAQVHYDSLILIRRIYIPLAPATNQKKESVMNQTFIVVVLAKKRLGKKVNLQICGDDRIPNSGIGTKLCWANEGNDGFWKEEDGTMVSKEQKVVLPGDVVPEPVLH